MFEINISRWDPLKNMTAAKEKEDSFVCKRVPLAPLLKNGEIVKIAAEANGTLLVQTKECFTLLQDIGREANEYKG